MRRDIRDIVRELNAALGPTLVSTLAGAKDTTVSLQWAGGVGEQPGAEIMTRLTFAHEQWHRVADTEGEQVARAWFIGANPWLGDDTPITAIREDRLKDVNNASQALIDDSFSG